MIKKQSKKSANHFYTEAKGSFAKLAMEKHIALQISGWEKRFLEKDFGKKFVEKTIWENNLKKIENLQLQTLIFVSHEIQKQPLKNGNQ